MKEKGSGFNFSWTLSSLFFSRSTEIEGIRSYFNWKNTLDYFFEGIKCPWQKALRYNRLAFDLVLIKSCIKSKSFLITRLLTEINVQWTYKYLACRILIDDLILIYSHVYNNLKLENFILNKIFIYIQIIRNRILRLLLKIISTVSLNLFTFSILL